MSLPPPDLSVIIATRDRPELLQHALAAIAAQRFDGVIETIVVFDQSEPDPSIERREGDRRVITVFNDRTPGLPGARNTGARVASAPVLGFCDDDDEWLPDKAAKQLAVLDARPEVDVVVSGTLTDFEGRRASRLPPPEIHFADLLRSRIMAANASNMVVRREAFFERIGEVDENIPGGYSEDYDFLLRAARSAPLAAVVEPLVLVQWGRGSYFSERWDMIDKALAYLLDKHPEFQGDPKGLARILGQRAFASAASGRRSDALGLVRQTLGANWREPRALISLVALAGVKPERVLHTLHRFGRGV
jgi:glycosyltransferase involved in cell wall biosynthesis